MNKTISVSVTTLVTLLLVTDICLAETEIELRASKILPDSVEIMGVTFGENDNTILVIDAYSDHVRKFTIEGGDFIERDPCGYTDEPRSVMWFDDLETVVTGDKNYGDKCQVVFQNNATLNVILDDLDLDIPYRLIPISNGFCGVFLTSEEGVYSYQIRTYTRNNEDDDNIWNSSPPLVDSVMNITNTYLLKSTCPSIAVCEIGDSEVLIVAWPSPFEYDTFSAYRIPPISDDANGTNSSEGISDLLLTPDPYLSWTAPRIRSSSDRQILERTVIADDSSYWESDPLPDAFLYRPIVDEIGTYKKQLWVLRGTQEYPVFDVYDLNNNNKPKYTEPIELNSFPALSEIWQYRISDEGIIAFCRNQIYVFEITD